MNELKTAIIDIGSNTIRLVLYQYDKEEGLREIGNIKTVARLRTYLQPSGEMSEEGIQVLTETLLTYKAMLDDFEVTDVKAAATAAIRQATNRTKIITLMKERTGIQIELLSEEEEAYYGFVAVAHSIGTKSAVTIDIGGGSTEITLFENKELQKSYSFPFGTVSLKQRFVKGEIMNGSEKNELIAFVKEQFKSLPWIQDIGLPIIAIGGSARNIAQIHQQKHAYPIASVHGYEMTKENLVELSVFLGSLSFNELKQLDGLSADRADIIAPALEVFNVLMEAVGSKLFQITKKGLREGLIIQRILQTDKSAFDKYNVFEGNAKRLARQYGRTEKEVDYLTRLTDQLYRECCRFGCLQHNPKDLQLLAKAAKVFNIGEYIELSSASQHTFYLIANQSIDGLNHKERVKLALLASYKNKDYFQLFAAPFTEWMSREEYRKIRDFGALLKFVYALNVSKRQIVRTIKIQTKEDYVQLNIYVKLNAAAEKYQANRHKKHLERALKIPIKINFIEEGLNNYDN
ncbi:Ppx/GppA family phosphatase [Lysinibacillus xylanilyticus]|uniref:Ppx/GppA family phosphatase n=1 Tax=Lysinibacillus xylanilyticus TaxID=582475 RepID=UPI002B248999|nr:Ppx/GppA family phosphatase [Lysinibacillus xylanilyticus]MEB2278768.1 Ppx/GppA family phosphatase [Lysinibacillus xylanilyticus]